MRSERVASAKKFSGRVTVPGDKSISHRGAILGAVAEGVTEISGYLTSGDCINTLAAVNLLGARVEGLGTERVKIHGLGLRGLKKPPAVLNLGNSGTGVRLLAGLVSGFPFTTVLDGDESLRKRPMQRITVPLSMMGARVEGERCPLKITGGGLKGIDYDSPVASAQVKSCVLIAGLFADGKTSIAEPVKSRDHTERMLQYFGLDIDISGLKVSLNGGESFTGKPIVVPGDISSAAFILAGALIVPGAEVTVERVGINPHRSTVLDVMRKMGADISVKNLLDYQNEPVADITARYSKLKGVDLGYRDIPSLIDELPIIAVLASFAEGETTVSGAEELRVKESDRIKTVIGNLKEMGVRAEEKRDGWIIQGGAKPRGAAVKSFGDHRVAMSMLICGLAAEGETVVEGTEWIDTSFPGFMKVLGDLTAI